jgi:holo-[acyl-carrier protein] synthase
MRRTGGDEIDSAAEEGSRILTCRPRNRARCTDPWHDGRVPFRVGIDLVAAVTVAEALAEHGERYLRRVYTDREIADCDHAGAPDPLRLAARFAAKEATMKVLRVGDAAVPFSAIEVVRGPDGAPALELHGAAAELAAAAGLRDFAISVTHELEYASAVVLAET